MRFPHSIRLPAATYADRTMVFHVVIRAAPLTTPFTGLVGQTVWDTVMNERERGSIDLLTACLMPDHLHTTMRPAGRSVLQWVNSFKSFSTHVARHGGFVGPLWQPSFYDRCMRDETELLSTIEYIRRNPADAGLESKAPWPWLWVADEFEERLVPTASDEIESSAPVGRGYE